MPKIFVLPMTTGDTPLVSKSLLTSSTSHLSMVHIESCIERESTLIRSPTWAGLEVDFGGESLHSAVPTNGLSHWANADRLIRSGRLSKLCCAKCNRQGCCQSPQSHKVWPWWVRYFRSFVFLCQTRQKDLVGQHSNLHWCCCSAGAAGINIASFAITMPYVTEASQCMVELYRLACAHSVLQQ